MTAERILKVPESQLGDIRESVGALKEGIKSLTSYLQQVDNRGLERGAKIYASLEEIKLQLNDYKTRTASLEQRIAEIEPFVRDYNDRLLQVRTAGRLGRLLWMAGGVLLAFAAWLVSSAESIGNVVMRMIGR